MTFTATAYCQRGITASGVTVRDGIVAADPDVLPLGTVIRLERAGRYDGVYRVLDTGADIRGRRLDLFVRNCREAVRFGRKAVVVTTVR